MTSQWPATPQTAGLSFQPPNAVSDLQGGHPLHFPQLSLPRNSLSPVLSKAPCVTRLIKTNTGRILVSNPIVLFFFKLALERRILVFGTVYRPPSMNGLQFQTLQDITYGGQSVNKGLLQTFENMQVEVGHLYTLYVCMTVVT